MCVEYIYFTPYLCQHLTCDGSNVSASGDCQSCGEVKQMRLRKEVGAPTTPCQWCRDHGVWVLHEGRWMTRRESNAWKQIAEQKQQIDRWVDGYMEERPPAGSGERRQLSAEETIERVTAAFERQRAAEQAKKDEDVLPSIEDP